MISRILLFDRTSILIAIAMVMASAAARLEAGIVSGEIQSVSEKTKRIVIIAGSKKVSKSYKLTPRTSITLDDKKADLQQLTAGQQVSLLTSSTGEVTKIIARSTSSSTNSGTDEPSTSKEDPDAASDSSSGKSRGSSRSSSSRSKKKSKTDLDDVLDTEWNQFRGPRRDNVSTETGYLQEWPDTGPTPVWGTQGLGEGFSSVSISDGVLYTMGTRDGAEYVIAINAENGTILWGTRTGAVFQNDAGNGPRSTPTIDGDSAYALGANGDLVSLDKKTGDIQWQKNILQEYQGNNITWGICESVLIDDKKLICTPGGRGATMVAMDKTTGKTIWTSEVPTNPAASYASAIVAEVGNVRQYINFTHVGVIGVRADDGAFLWGNQASANGTANCSAPMFHEDYVFSSSGYGTGGALLELRSANGRTMAEQKYHTNEMANHHGGMVVVDGYLYGSHDPGILTCIELKSGKVKWKNRSVGKGSVLYADGCIYLRSEGGPMALVEANPDRYVEKGRFEQPNRSGKPAWAYHVVSQGKMYLRDLDNLFCYDVSANN